MKILAIRQLGGIGDFLSMSPVFRGLKEKFPEARIELATSRLYASGSLLEIAERNPFIDKIHSIEPYDGTTKQTRGTWGKYYKDCPSIEESGVYKSADIVIDLNTACVDYEWPAMRSETGIMKPRYQIWCEHAEVSPSDIRPVYKPRFGENKKATSELTALGLDLRKPVVGLGVKAFDPKRGLGIKKVEKIADGLTSAGIQVVSIDQTAKVGPFNIIGKRISELMPMIGQMDLVITADSGILHMAGTMDTTILGIFGPTDPEMRMKPYRGKAIDAKLLVDCAPCWYLYPCLNKSTSKQFECMKKIGPELVVEEAKRMLQSVVQ